MFDVCIQMQNKPGELARMGKILGQNGISIEGGGVWAIGESCVAHFLFSDGESTRSVLETNGFQVLDVRQVVVLRLNQEKPGQLGAACQKMADSGINIEVQYSDHHNQLILVVDHWQRAQVIANAWMAKEKEAPK